MRRAARNSLAARPGTPLRGLAYWVGTFALVIVVNGLLVSTITLSDEGKGWDFGDIGGAKEWMPGYNPWGFFAHFSLGVLAAWAIAYGIATLSWRWIERPALRSRWANKRYPAKH